MVLTIPPPCEWLIFLQCSQFFYVAEMLQCRVRLPTTILKSDIFQHSKLISLPRFGPTRMGLASMWRGMKWVSKITPKYRIDLVSFFFKFTKLHFFQKKFTWCSNNYIKFILEGKWTFGVISYTLSHAKSNETIHFVLSHLITHLEKIPISDGFLTQLHICTVVQRLHIYKKTYPKLCTIKGSKHLHRDWAWQLNDRLMLNEQLSASTGQLV